MTKQKDMSLNGGKSDTAVFKTNNHRDDSRPALIASALRLYRNDTLWRGAVDLLCVGTLIMLLVNGFPDIFSSLDRILPSFSSKSLQHAADVASNNPANTISATPTTASTAPSSQTSTQQQAAANFTPSAPSSNDHQAATSAIPKPIDPKSDSAIPRHWIGKISDKDKELFEHATDLISVDNQKAISLLQEKVSVGDANAQYLMGAAFVNETLFYKKSNSLSDAIDWYKKAALNGHPDAQSQLGQIYRIGAADVHQDIFEAMKWYEMAIANPEDHMGLSENEMGRLFQFGQGVAKNETKALEYYEKAAAKGEIHALTNAGAFYYDGKGAPRNIPKAIDLITQAANKGYPGAQLSLAVIYMDGKLEGHPNYELTLKWAGLATEQGNVDAMILLGDLYHYGKTNFEIDQKQAARFYRMAALKKHPKGQFLFGEMYEQGTGIPQDNIQAYVYYTLSYKGGYTPSYAAIQALEKRMSPSDLEYAQKMTKALTIDSK